MSRADVVRVVCACLGATVTACRSHGARVVRVAVTERGFAPAEVRAGRSQPVTLVFTRLTEMTDSTALVVHAPGGPVLRELPLGAAVPVTLAPAPGRVRFADSVGDHQGEVVFGD